MWSSDDCFFFFTTNWRKFRRRVSLATNYLLYNMTNRKGRKSKVRFRRNLENSGNNSTLVEILVSILFNPFSQHDIVQPLFALISRKLF